MASPAEMEKAAVDPSHIEHIAKGSDAGEEDITMGFTPEEQKRIIRRLDYRLVTTAGVLYCISLMDRTNLGAAVIAGMSEELKLTGYRYVCTNKINPTPVIQLC